ALNYGDNFFVQLEPTDDPMVWIVRSTRRETNLPRNVRITFTVTGRDHGGQATTQRPLVVRSLGDVDGNGGVEPTDMAALINALNGMPPQGYDAEAFDLDANGGAEPGDLSVLINILNGLPIP
ncbi:MAG: hypothetical protein JW955_13105, partial [Sedimentisphaerales bacterium]|nr:hypothetical protein [Sedimentisphaerales bacterium]